MEQHIQTARKFIKNNIKILEQQLPLLRCDQDILPSKEFIGIDMVIKKGLIIPEGEIRYKVLIDSYPHLFLQSMILMLKKLNINEDHIFSYFLLKTCIEMCTKKAGIIFDNTPNNKERSRLILCLLVQDYASIGWNGKKFYSDYFKLASELVLENEKHKKLNNLSKAVKENSESLYSKIKDFRLHVTEKVLDSAIKKVGKSAELEFDNLNMKFIFNELSHYLHGNIFKIKDILNSSVLNRRNNMTSNAVQLFCSSNLVIAVENYLISKDLGVLQDISEYKEESANIQKLFIDQYSISGK